MIDDVLFYHFQDRIWLIKITADSVFFAFSAMEFFLYPFLQLDRLKAITYHLLSDFQGNKQ